MLVMFLSSFFIRQILSELPPPIAENICHIITNLFDYINLVQKFVGAPPPPQKKNWRDKTCKISVNFGRTHWRERKFDYLNWFSTRNCGAGRPHVGLCPAHLVFFIYLFFRHAFSEVPQPIAVKLGHMIGNCLNFIIQVQKFGGPSPKKIWGPKTCKISVDYVQPPTLISNISGTAQDI